MLKKRGRAFRCIFFLQKRMPLQSLTQKNTPLRGGNNEVICQSKSRLRQFLSKFRNDIN